MKINYANKTVFVKLTASLATIKEAYRIAMQMGLQVQYVGVL